jgi:replicative DNA helicase
MNAERLAEVERCILGIELLRPGSMEETGIEPAHFHSGRHAALARLLLEMTRGGDLVGVKDGMAVVEVVDRLSGDPDLAERLCGPTRNPAWITALPEAPPTTENVDHYARLLKEETARRTGLEGMAALRERLLEGEPTDGVADDLEKLARQVRKGGGRVDLRLDAPLVADLLSVAYDTFLARSEKRETPFPVPWPSVAQALGGGLWPGWVYVLVGNPGTGKSQWAMQAAMQAARMGRPVVYIGLELGRVDLVARLLGLLAGVRWSSVFFGDLEAPPQMPGANAVAELFHRWASDLERLPFRMETGTSYGWSYDRLSSLARQVAREHGQPPLLVLDYLQLAQSPPDVREELRERVGKASYHARQVARDLGATVVLVSSTARENYGKLAGAARKGEEVDLGRADPTLLMGAGKEAGEVEYAADAVLVLAREPFLPEPEAGATDTRPRSLREDRRCLVWLARAKIRALPRDAGRGWVPLLFNGGDFSEPSPGDVDEWRKARARPQPQPREKPARNPDEGKEEAVDWSQTTRKRKDTR